LVKRLRKGNDYLQKRLLPAFVLVTVDCVAVTLFDKPELTHQQVLRVYSIIGIKIKLK